MECWEFCREVLKYIPRATRQERNAIRWELRDHVMDSAQALEENGCSALDSVGRAVEAMGDPAEIGRAFNALLSPFWLWLGRGAAALAVLLCLLLFSNWSGLVRWGRSVTARAFPGYMLYELRGRVYALAEVEENGESKYYTFTVNSPEEAGYTQRKDCDFRLELDNEELRVFRLYREPDNGRVGLALVEYAKDPHGYIAALSLDDTHLISQRGIGGGELPTPAVRGEYRSVQTGKPVAPEDSDERVNVVFSWQGTDWHLGNVDRQGDNWLERHWDSWYYDDGVGVRFIRNVPVEPGDTYIKLVCRGKELTIPLPWEVEE